MKKLFTILTVIMMTVAMTACEEDNGGSSNQENSEETTNEFVMLKSFIKKDLKSVQAELTKQGYNFIESGVESGVEYYFYIKQGAIRDLYLEIGISKNSADVDFAMLEKSSFKYNSSYLIDEFERYVKLEKSVFKSQVINAEGYLNGSDNDGNEYDTEFNIYNELLSNLKGMKDYPYFHALWAVTHIDYMTNISCEYDTDQSLTLIVADKNFEDTEEAVGKAKTDCLKTRRQ